MIRQSTSISLYTDLGNSLRSLDVAEPSTFHFDPVVALLGGIANLPSDMLALSVTIGPDDEGAGRPRFRLDVLGDGLLVLGSVLVTEDGQRATTREAMGYQHRGR